MKGSDVARKYGVNPSAFLNPQDCFNIFVGKKKPSDYLVIFLCDISCCVNNTLMMKKQLLIVGITLVLIAVGLSVCTQEESSDLYINTDLGFSINPPDGWTLVETGDAVEFYGYEDEDGYVTVMYIVPTTQELGYRSEESMKEANEDVSEGLYGFTIISQQERTVDGQNAYEFVMSFFIGEDEFKVKQIGVEKDDKILSVNYNSPIDTYDTYL